MALDAKTKKLLNDFSLSQVALNDREKPFPSSALKLGDLLEEAMNAQIEADLTQLEIDVQTAQATAEDAENQAYTAVDLHWADADPATLKEAIDRLAAAVYALQSNNEIA